MMISSTVVNTQSEGEEVLRATDRACNLKHSLGHEEAGYNYRVEHPCI